MKQLILILLLVPNLLFSEEKYLSFKVNSNHYYEFQLKLKEHTRYYFRLKGEGVFNFRIVESSGNEWPLYIANPLNGNKLIVWDNILDGGVYTIRIYSVADNRIQMTYGDY